MLFKFQLIAFLKYCLSSYFPTNCFECIVSHLICLGFHHFLPLSSLLKAMDQGVTKVFALLLMEVYAFFFPLEINVLEMIVYIDIIKESSIKPCLLSKQKKSCFHCTISFVASYSHLASHYIFFEQFEKRVGVKIVWDRHSLHKEQMAFP